MGVARRGTVYAGFDLELVERSAHGTRQAYRLDYRYITGSKIVGIL